MRGVAKTAFLLVVLGAMIGCQNGNGLPQIPSKDLLAEADLQYYWTSTLPLLEDEEITDANMVGEKLYFLTNRNQLIALDAKMGLISWSVDVARPGTTVYSPVHVDGLKLAKKAPSVVDFGKPDPEGLLKPFDAVCVNTISYLQVYSRKTGELIRKIDMGLDASASNAGVADKKHFFVVDDRGVYNAIKLREGVRVWNDSAEGMCVAPLQYYNEKFYVPTLTGKVTAVWATRYRSTAWKMTLEGAVSASVNVSKLGCFIPCENGFLYAVNPDNGRELWEPFDCRGELMSPPQVTASTILQYENGGKMYAINVANGEQRWILPGAKKLVATRGNTLYILDNSQRLLVVDEMLGKIQKSLHLSQFTQVVGSTTGDAIYAVKDGKVYCIRHKSAGKITAEMLKEAK